MELHWEPRAEDYGEAFVAKGRTRWDSDFQGLGRWARVVFTLLLWCWVVLVAFAGAIAGLPGWTVAPAVVALMGVWLWLLRTFTRTPVRLSMRMGRRVMRHRQMREAASVRLTEEGLQARSGTDHHLWPWSSVERVVETERLFVLVVRLTPDVATVNWLGAVFSRLRRQASMALPKRGLGDPSELPSFRAELATRSGHEIRPVTLPLLN